MKVLIKEDVLNQIIASIRLHKQWQGGSWVYSSMTKDYVMYLNDLCDNLKLEEA